MPKAKAPSLRRSQAVTTFGPGSIVDFRDGSYMMAGLDFWPENETVEIHEPNLEKALHVKEFRLPSLSDSTGGKNLPAVIFPEWMICPKCNRLARYTEITNFLHAPMKIIRCPECKVPVHPARLVVACPKGHIEDFPWVEWVHRKSKPQKNICNKPVLRIQSTGLSSSLSDLVITCEGLHEDGSKCDAKATLNGATQEKEFKGWFVCHGKRPWLLDQENCDLNVYPLQRGASNVYFASTVSSISIPPWSKSVHKIIDKSWNAFRGMKTRGTILETIDGMSLSSRLNMSPEDILDAILLRQAQESGETGELTENQIRWEECQALRKKTGYEDPLSEFLTKKAETPSELQDLISSVMLVEKLREVRVLMGFTRVDSPDPASRLQGMAYAPLSKTRLDWRPAIEVRGEGIYLELDEEAITLWENQNKNISLRAEKLDDAYAKLCAMRGWEPNRVITPKFILAHSLAHCLIRQLALDCGYSSASLRERLYVFDPDVEKGTKGITGLLIYTSTTDAEGSLGGLVRQGFPKHLSNLFQSALQDVSWCSSDPLCLEGENTGPDGTNLAACHACLLLPETCCEEFNRFLDRATLVGTSNDPSIGFFTQYLEK